MQATTTTAEDRVARAGTAAVVETVAEPVIESKRGASPARIGSPGSARGCSKDADTRVRVSRVFKAVVAGLPATGSAEQIDEAT